MSAETAMPENEWPSAEIAEFSLRLVYPFAFDQRSEKSSLLGRLTALTVPQLMESLPVPAALMEKIARQQAKGTGLPVWEVDARTISDDFYPHIRRLLGAETNADSTGYVLTTAAWQFLTGDFGSGFGDGMEIELSNIAARRLGLPEREKQKYWLPFSMREGMGKLNPPRLHLFGSGIGVLEIELSPHEYALKQHGLAAASEFIHTLSHLGNKAPQVRWQGTQDTTRLETIFTALLAGMTQEDIGAPALLEPLVDDRLFSFACLRTVSLLPGDEARRVAHGLAQRQTMHYLPTAEARNKRLFMPFENIVYAMSTEGGAVVIGTVAVDGMPVEFSKRYIGDVVKKAYWPLALLAYTEFRKLVRLSGDVCRMVNFQDPSDDDLKFLEAFRGEILNFRLNYRFSQVSQISNHNEYYAAWRQALGNVQLLTELSPDVNEVDDFLSYKLDQKRLKLEQEKARIEAQREAARQRRAETNNLRYSYFGILITAIVLVMGLLGSNLTVYMNSSVYDPIVWGTTGVVVMLAFVVIGIRWWMDKNNR